MSPISQPTRAPRKALTETLRLEGAIGFIIRIIYNFRASGTGQVILYELPDWHQSIKSTGKCWTTDTKLASTIRTNTSDRSLFQPVRAVIGLPDPQKMFDNLWIEMNASLIDDILPDLI